MVLASTITSSRRPGSSARRRHLLPRLLDSSTLRLFDSTVLDLAQQPHLVFEDPGLGDLAALQPDDRDRGPLPPPARVLRCVEPTRAAGRSRPAVDYNFANGCKRERRIHGDRKGSEPEEKDVVDRRRSRSDDPARAAGGGALPERYGVAGRRYRR